MTFDAFISSSDYDPMEGSYTDLIGLGFLYLEENRSSKEGISSSDINSLIENSRSSVSNVYQYITMLSDSGYIDENSNGWYLTYEGIEHYKELAGTDSELIHERESVFIKIETSVQDAFYRKLIDNINKCYKTSLDGAALVLTRKLIENLMIDILRENFGMGATELFYDTDRDRHHGYDTLRQNMDNKISELKRCSTCLEQRIIDDLEEFRKDGNAGAHSISLNITDEEMENKSEKASHLVEVLFRVLEDVKSTS